jgi:hypothetical protein
MPEGMQRTGKHKGIREKRVGEFTQLRLNKTTAQISRMMKRLLMHGLIKGIGKTYKYFSKIDLQFDF